MKNLEKKALEEFVAMYNRADRDTICTALGIDFDDDVPNAEDLNFVQQCEFLGVSSVLDLYDVRNLADVMLRIEFAKSYLHKAPEDFFASIKKRRAMGKEEEYLFYESKEEYLESLGLDDADQHDIEPQWEGRWGVCYFVE